MNLENVFYYIILIGITFPIFVRFYLKRFTCLKEHQYPEWKYHIWLFSSTVVGIVLGLAIYSATRSIISYRNGTPLIIILSNIVLWFKLLFWYNCYPLPHFNDLPSYFKYEKQLKELKRQQKEQRKRNNRRR